MSDDSVKAKAERFLAALQAARESPFNSVFENEARVASRNEGVAVARAVLAHEREREALAEVEAAVDAVLEFDWGENDDDAFGSIERLQAAKDKLDEVRKHGGR